MLKLPHNHVSWGASHSGDSSPGSCKAWSELPLSTPHFSGQYPQKTGWLLCTVKVAVNWHLKSPSSKRLARTFRVSGAPGERLQEGRGHRSTQQLGVHSGWVPIMKTCVFLNWNLNVTNLSLGGHVMWESNASWVQVIWGQVDFCFSLSSWLNQPAGGPGTQPRNL